MSDKTLYQNYAARLEQRRQDRFDEIKRQHFVYQEQRTEDDVDPVEILAFIERSRIDAFYILDICQRDHLRKMLHLWVSVIYDDIGYYPQVDLLTPLDWSDRRARNVRF